MNTNCVVDCGWGKLVFAKTFTDEEKMAAVMKDEALGERNILFDSKCLTEFYASHAEDFFVNPAFIYEFDLTKKLPEYEYSPYFSFRTAQNESDIEVINTLYTSLAMVPLKKNWLATRSGAVEVFVVEDIEEKRIIGACVVINHGIAIDCPQKNYSLWGLARCFDAPHRGVGRALMRYIKEVYAPEQSQRLLLSVLKENIAAQKFYEKLGFSTKDIITVKNKTAINQKNFS